MSRRWLFLLIYALSGAAALIYEVSWTRLFGLVMGHGTAAVSTVLAAYMGGMALGALAAGQSAPRWSRSRALRIYAGLELVIALAAVLLPVALERCQPVLAIAYGHDGGGWAFSAVRVTVCLLLLLAPTAAMGATFPVATRWFVRATARPGAEAGALYGANTVGASAGAVAAGFILLPVLGTSRTTMVAVALNTVVAAVALAMAGRVTAAAPDDVPTAQLPSPARTRPAAGGRRGGRHQAPSQPTLSPPQPRIAAFALAVSGCVALMSEVTWTRVLALVLGPTSYAFSAMLAIFIGGLAIGAVVGSWLAHKSDRCVIWLGTALALTVVGNAGVTPFINRLPLVIARAGAMPDVAFVSMMALQGLLGLAVLLPMTIALGAAFPLAVAVATRDADRVSRDVSLIYAANTAGAITGALVAGFVLVPMLGLQHTMRVAAALGAFGSAGIILAFPSARRRRLAALSVPAVALAATLAMPVWDMELLTSGAYKYAPYLAGLDVESALRAGTLLYTADGRAGTVSVRRTAGTLTLAIDGKIDASDGGDMLTQKLLGHLPMLLHPAPDRACVIGLGSGVTLSAVLRHPVRNVDVIEISPEVVRAADYFRQVNRNALADPRTRLVIGDGRSHLFLTRADYDVIISEPSNPWISGMAALFTREFFQAVRARLAPGGIACQWAHTYDMQESDLRSIVATFTAVFPETTIWLVGESDVLLIGSAVPLEQHLARITEQWTTRRIGDDLRSVDVSRPFSVMSLLVAGSSQARVYAKGAAIQTDDRLALEYSAPRALYTRGGAGIVERLVGLARPDTLPEEFRRRLAQASAVDWVDRGRMLLRAEAPRRAYDSFDRAIGLQNWNREALDGLASASGPADLESEALDRLRRLLAENADNVAAATALSRLLASRGEWEESERVETDTLRRAPSDPAVREQLASLYADRDLADRLRPLVADMTRDWPNRPDTPYYAAVLRFLEGRPDQAVALAQAAVRVNPGHGRAWILLGVSLAATGRAKDARVAFEAAIGADPRAPSAYLNLGLLERERGDDKSAAARFAEALAVDPSYEPARHALADVLDRQGAGDRAALLRRPR